MKKVYAGSLKSFSGNIEQLQSLPPGCQQNVKGIFNVKIQTLYLNTCRQAIGMKCKFWGMQGSGVNFLKIDESTKQLSLSIRSNLESLSKYLNDMKLLCIQLSTQMAKQNQEKASLQKRIKIPKQSKHIGWIFINIQRYIISHILNNFQETVNIVDLRKQKIGEAKVIVTLQMLKQSIIIENEIKSDIKHFQAHNKISFERQNVQGENKLIDQQRIISNRDLGFRKSNEESFQFERQFERHKQKIKIENFAFNDNKKKGKAQLFLQQYERNKPQHTQLSLIRQKYGFNLPSVQVMKLKYDEVRLLSKENNITLKQEARVNLLLKSIKLQGKQKVDYLMIYCEQRQKKLETETKLILSQEIINQKIEINYLYTIPNNPTDVLIFQIKDAKFQAQISQISKSDKIQLKAKNNKKLATIDFTLISQDGIIKSKLNQINQVRDQKQSISKTKKDKQHGYINVLNWKQNRIVLKNKNFGVLQASKILFQINEPNSLDLTIELENQNHLISHINLNLFQLFKEQNYTLNGNSVKVITAKGQLSQILSLIQKLQPGKIEEQNQVIPNSKIQKDFQKDEIIKQLVKIYINLEESQDFQCHQILQDLTSSRQVSKKKLQKLAKIINVEISIIQKALSNLFNNIFQSFYTSFRIFHDWNHKYKQLQKKIKHLSQSDLVKTNLIKTIKKIKRSSQIMFGLIPNNIFLNQFAQQGHQNQRIATEHAQNEMDFEQIGRLINLLFQRYHNRFIKISELQEFISQHNKYFNLNTYLLLKIVQELKKQKQQFSQHLIKEVSQILQIFNSKLSHPIQFGLAKILFTQENQLAQDSILSVEQNFRKQTEDNFKKQTESRQQVYKIRTQESKQPTKYELIKLEQDQKHHKYSHQEQQNQKNISNLPKKLITVIIKRVILLKKQQISQISLTSQNESLILANQLLQFPKAINLIENAAYNVRVKANKEEYQGVFLASADPKKIKLYKRQKQSGFLQLFGNDRNDSEQSQLVVRLKSQEVSFLKQRRFFQQSNQIPQSYQQISINQNNSTLIKSPFAKMHIRSIQPSRPHFTLQIINQNNAIFKRLEFPKQNQIVLSNSPKGWKLNLLNQQYEQILIPNYKGSNKYCFINSNTQKIGYIIIIEVEQFWDSGSIIEETQSLYICLNFDRFLALKQFQSKTYNILLQFQKDIFQIGSIENSFKSRILQSQISYKLTRRTKQITAKLVCHQSKVTVCSFKFIPKPIEKGIQKSQRFLIADQNGYRLKITIYQLRNQWNYFRPQKIVNLFTYPNKKTIESFLHENGSITQQMLIFWLKSTFQLTLGQIEILFNDVFATKHGEYVQCLQKTFRKIKLGQTQNISDILQQFSIFDVTETGVINSNQMNIIKKILQRNFKQIYNLMNKEFKNYLTCHEVQGSSIVDLSKIKDPSDFDYLSFLSLFQDSIQIKKQILPSNECKISDNKSKYLSLKLLSFSKLSINEAPATLLFKINGENLAEPIHRCYSHNYSNPIQMIIKNDGNQYLQIFCQKLSSQGNWDYKLNQKVVLSKEVKILGGTINFQIKQIDQKAEQVIKSFEKTNKKKEIDQIQRKENQLQNIEKKEDFSKSFWNKSLNQTRQKWLNANKSGTGKKQNRKLPELDRQNIKKKMNFFDKEWDD